MLAISGLPIIGTVPDSDPIVSIPAPYPSNSFGSDRIRILKTACTVPDSESYTSRSHLFSQVFMFCVLLGSAIAAGPKEEAAQVS